MSILTNRRHRDELWGLLYAMLLLALGISLAAVCFSAADRTPEPWPSQTELEQG